MSPLMPSISADGRSRVPEIKDRDDGKLDNKGFPSVMFACFDIDNPSTLLARDLDDGRFISTFECADDAYTEIAEAEEGHHIRWEVCKMSRRDLNIRGTAGILHKWALTTVPEVFPYE